MRISAVSYLNTKPFLHGIKTCGVPGVSLSLDVPSECARKLLEGEAEIGLVPVAVLPLLKSYSIISNYCIGAAGPVQSVKLYSEVPLEKIETVWLDHQSRTSVMLARVLAKERWKISPHWQHAAEGFEQRIAGASAGVVIGDRTFAMNGKFAYEFDLAEEWIALTGLPFVFAAWVSTVLLHNDFLEQFDKALSYGVTHIDEMLQQEKTGTKNFDAARYLKEAISYPLDKEKRKGLELFLEKIKGLSL